MIPRQAIAGLLLLAACASPPRAEKAKPDPKTDAGYADGILQLATLNREAEDLFQRGQPDAAAALITKAQPLQARLLATPRPTLAAMERVSDLDDLYARMLLSNRNDGWARMLYQKNVARWKNWKPQTVETARYLRQAQKGIAECDRRLPQ